MTKDALCGARKLLKNSSITEREVMMCVSHRTTERGVLAELEDDNGSVLVSAVGVDYPSSVQKLLKALEIECKKNT
jgi:hypothetical protein